jgi:hypothetical protein
MMPAVFAATDQTSCNIADARFAAAWLPTAEARRVFTRPGTGGLAKIQTGMPAGVHPELSFQPSSLLTGASGVLGRARPIISP